MPTPIEILVDRYPALAGEIREAADNGHDAEAIQASVNRLTKSMGESGYSPVITEGVKASPLAGALERLE